MMNSTYNSAWHFGPAAFLGFGALGIGVTLIGIIVILCVVALKGYSLWHAAKRDEKGWFIALLIVNTFGILELIYLYFIVGKWHNIKSASESTDTTPKN